MQQRSLLLRAATPRLMMRFDKERPTVVLKDVDASLRPRTLHAHHTPFPLPVYDEALGFGPTRMQHIPDVARARAAVIEQAKDAAVGSLDVDGAEDDAGQPAVELVPFGETSPPAAHTSTAYEHQEGYPLLDRLVCNRSLDDLLRQYLEHPTMEGKSAAVSDMASTLHLRSEKEFVQMLSTLGGTLEPDGKGLNFLARRVHGFQASFFVPGALLSGFTGFITAVEGYFTTDNALRLRRSQPAVVVELLHFLARAQILQPDRWFTRHETQTSNMASSLGPKGHNRHHYEKGYGVALLDGIKDSLVDSGEEHQLLLDRCSMSELAELLAGLSAVDPNGFVDGAISNEILRHFFSKFPVESKHLSPSEQAEMVGRLAFVMEMAHVTNDDVWSLAANYPPSGQLMMALARRQPVQPDVLEANIRTCHAELKHGRVKQQVLLEVCHGLCEVLQALPDKNRAAELVRELDLDTVIFNCIPFGRRDNDEVAGATVPTSRAATRSNHVLNRTSTPFTYKKGLERIRGLTAVNILHSSVVVGDVSPLVHACYQLRSGRVGLIVTTQTLLSIARRAMTSTSSAVRKRCLRSLQLLFYEIRRGRVCLATLEDELAHIRDAGTFADEDVVVWSLAASLAHDAPMTMPKMMVFKGHSASAPHRFLNRHSLEGLGSLSSAHMNLSSSVIGKQKELASRARSFASRELLVQVRTAHHTRKVRDAESKVHHYNTQRARLAYRRDRPLYDKFRPRGRYNALGFSAGGSLFNDMRGLGIHTPDHPQPAGVLRCVAKPDLGARVAGPRQP